MDYKKLSVSILGFLYCMYYIFSLDSWHFIDNINLIFHEAGHIIFLPFGEFLTIAGGSILQILIPLVCAVYFLIKSSYFSSSLLLYWVGINFVNVSVYAGDALKMQLPLLTGYIDSHDWNQILFRLNMLKFTDEISNLIFAIGVLVFIISLISGIYFSYKQNLVNYEE